MLPDPPPPADAPGTVPPIRMDPDHPPPVVSFRGIVKQSLTKKSRLDLGTGMVKMCQLTGWPSTTLNPDMDDDTKLGILTVRFGKLATSADVGQQESTEKKTSDIITGRSHHDVTALYDDLIALSAVTMGWAQGIARREARDRKRRSRERKRIRKEERKRAKRKAAEDQ